VQLVNFIKYIAAQILLLPTFSKTWDDVVFKQRNKKYGAYELRRLVAKNQFLGLSVTLSFFLFLFAFLFFKSDSDQDVDFEFEKMVEFKGFDANLISVQPLKKEQAPPAPTEPEEPKEEPEEKKDLPPEVKKDKPEPVAETKKPLNVDSLRKATDKTGVDTGKKYIAGLDSGIVQPKYVEGPADAYGGKTEFLKWVQQNIKIPKEAIENNVHGTVYVHFTIDEKGNLTKVTISKGLGYGCDEAVLEVIRRAPPWKPAIRDGQPVPTRFIVPIKI